MKAKEAVENLALCELSNSTHWDNRSKKTISMAIEALEKQVPKKPVGAKKFGNLMLGNCPSCGNPVGSAYRHCQDCGQAIDWTEGE